MMRINVCFLFIFLFFGTHNVFAADHWCDNTMTNRGLGPANMIMKCGAEGGYISNSAPLKKLKVIITRQGGVREEHVLENPPGGIRDYYAIQYNDWVKSQLRLGDSDTVEVAKNGGYMLDGSTILYQDSNMRTPKGSLDELVPQKSGGSTDISCRYTKQPETIRIPNERFGQKIEHEGVVYSMEFGSRIPEHICVASVECNVRGKIVNTVAVCTAYRGCPDDANRCANDEEITVSEYKGEQTQRYQEGNPSSRQGTHTKR